MYVKRIAVRLLIVALLLGSGITSSAGAGSRGASADSASPKATESLRPSSETAPATAAQVTLSAGQATTSWDSRLAEPKPFELPVLHLHRERRPTADGERTLTLHLSGLPAGMAVEAALVSRHGNTATGAQHRVSRRFSLPDRPCTDVEPCALSWTLDAATTLSDYYRLTLRDGEGRLLWENPDPERPDLVALDTWEIGVEEHTVRIIYAVLFPYARGELHFDKRLAPDAVHTFISDQLVPIVTETWETQFGSWGLGPIHPAWDADQVVEVYLTAPPYALYDGTGPYTLSTRADGSPYPERRIWLPSNSEILGFYDSLANGYKVTLSHEFYHLVQWNVGLSASCLAPKWPKAFTEAQATFAPSAQYPELEMSNDPLVAAASLYGATARRFIERQLKTSYAALEAHESSQYDLAPYWRFLYEQYGDLRPIRAALEEMACLPAMEVPTSLGQAMDAALARLEGPFASYEQSITAFAAANYALRLEDGRCTAADLGACAGRYYDPHGTYTAPSLRAFLNHRGSVLAYDGSIGASYGTDLIEVSLHRDVHGQPVTLAFRSEGARFSVQAWKLTTEGTDVRDPARGKKEIRALTAQPQVLFGDCDAECRYTIPRLNLAQYDRMALIVVRLDPHEGTDPVGAYHLALYPAR